MSIFNILMCLRGKSDSPAGCGKTSVISLLERFYHPQSGKITYDGIDISTLDIAEYRKAMSLVSQEPTLYQGPCLLQSHIFRVHQLILPIRLHQRKRSLRRRCLQHHRCPNTSSLQRRRNRRLHHLPTRR